MSLFLELVVVILNDFGAPSPLLVNTQYNVFHSTVLLLLQKYKQITHNFIPVVP